MCRLYCNFAIRKAFQKIMRETISPEGVALTGDDARAHVVRMRAEGLTMAAIADHMNERGSTTITGQPWTVASIQYTLRFEPKVNAKTWEPVHDPHELLEQDPNNRAALMDLADRRRYFATGKWSAQQIKAVAAAYEAKI